MRRLGGSARDLAAAGGKYARHRAALAADTAVDSQAAGRVRGRAADARDRARSARRTANRWSTIACVAGIAWLFRKIRSQPVGGSGPGNQASGGRDTGGTTRR